VGGSSFLERVHFTCLATLGSRGRKGEGEGAISVFACVGGALERRGTPPLAGGFSVERETTSKARTKTKQVQRQVAAKAKQRIGIKIKAIKRKKAHQGKGRLTS